MENKLIFLYHRNLNLRDAEVKGKPPAGLGGLRVYPVHNGAVFSLVGQTFLSVAQLTASLCAGEARTGWRKPTNFP